MMSCLGPPSRFVSVGFRSGEMTVLSGRFSTQKFIWGGMMPPLTIVLTSGQLKFTSVGPKTDQLRNGVDVVIGRTQDCLDPVAATAHR